MTLDSLLNVLGDRVQAPDEETFHLFAQQFPSQNLGFIDSRVKTLELTVAGRDLTIHQSPGILSSSRAGGTTGAVVWKVTPLFAEWISSPTNPLFAHELLTADSSVIELGCGIAGIVALLLAPRISNYILTDQPYVAKLLEQNISENIRGSKPHPSSSSSSSSKTKHRPSKHSSKSKSPAPPPQSSPPTSTSTSSSTHRRHHQIRFTPLDWETDLPSPSLLTSGTILSPSPSPPPAPKSLDAILALDCIYNEALVSPFISTCIDICTLRQNDENHHKNPTVVIIGQQLRDPSVFEVFIEAFTEAFDVWRVGDSLLPGGLRSGEGFVVHVGVLKGTGTRTMVPGLDDDGGR